MQDKVPEEKITIHYCQWIQIRSPPH